MSHVPPGATDQKQNQNRPVAKDIRDEFAHGQKQHARKKRVGKAAVNKGVAQEAAQVLDREGIVLKHPGKDFTVEPVVLNGRRSPAHRIGAANEPARAKGKGGLYPDQHQKEGNQEGRQGVDGGGWSLLGHGTSP
mgnify:CR=1 FL=1